MGLRILSVLLLFAVSLPPAVAIKPMHFETPAQEARYQSLLHELRCMVCQNQSLASSNADLAADMRHVVHRKILAGKSNAEIKDFLVARYGNFVLYRPPVEVATWLLWFGPAVLVVIGLIALMIAVRGRWRRAGPDGLHADDRQRLRNLLNRHEDP